MILDQLMTARVCEGKGLLCEEYADCLASLVKSSKQSLTPYTAHLVTRVKLAMDRATTPAPISLTNKARFALMDICDEI